jgi:TRAP-type C4-dicarboxylate transport system permease small subunit
MRHAIIKADAWLGHIVEALAMAILVAYASLCMFQVVVRFMVDVSATWTEAITRTLMIWGVYLGAMALFRMGTLISVDFVQSMARGTFLRVLRLVHFVAALVVLSVACVFGFQLVWRIRYQVLAGVEISIAWAYLAIPVGALLCLVALIARFLQPGSPADAPMPQD